MNSHLLSTSMHLTWLKISKSCFVVFLCFMFTILSRDWPIGSMSHTFRNFGRFEVECGAEWITRNSLLFLTTVNKDFPNLHLSRLWSQFLSTLYLPQIHLNFILPWNVPYVFDTEANIWGLNSVTMKIIIIKFLYNQQSCYLIPKLAFLTFKSALWTL